MFRKLSMFICWFVCKNSWIVWLVKLRRFWVLFFICWLIKRLLIGWSVNVGNLVCFLLIFLIWCLLFFNFILMLFRFIGLVVSMRWMWSILVGWKCWIILWCMMMVKFGMIWNLLILFWLVFYGYWRYWFVFIW